MTMKLLRKKLLCVFPLTLAVLSVLLPLRAISADYISNATATKHEESSARQKQVDLLQALVGTKYWYVPNLEAFSRITFLPGIPEGFPYGNDGFRPAGPTVFEVKEIATKTLTTAVKITYLIVQFEDGRTAAVPTFSEENPFKVYEGTKNPFEEFVYTENPASIARKEQAAAVVKKQAQKLASSKREARGGVLIGMSRDEVLASKWGRPQSVNKTSTAHGTSEQWVYGGRNYLYFQNGVLTSVQN
jgi:hypothetical protein